MSEEEILNACSQQEQNFYYSVLQPCINPEFITAQYEFIESTGRKRRIDFAIIGADIKLAIEFDGYSYHAQGQISQSDFSDQLHRQNELVLAGWTVLRFSWQQVVNDPLSCRDIIMRAIQNDNELKSNYRESTYIPTATQVERAFTLGIIPCPKCGLENQLGTNGGACVECGCPLFSTVYKCNRVRPMKSTPPSNYSNFKYNSPPVYSPPPSPPIKTEISRSKPCDKCHGNGYKSGGKVSSLIGMGITMIAPFFIGKFLPLSVINAIVFFYFLWGYYKSYDTVSCTDCHGKGSI